MPGNWDCEAGPALETKYIARSDRIFILPSKLFSLNMRNRMKLDSILPWQAGCRVHMENFLSRLLMVLSFSDEISRDSLRFLISMQCGFY